MRNLRTKREDVVMISWFSVSRRGRVAHPARTVAWVIFLATTAPWPAYAANGGLMSLKKVAVPEPSNLGTVVKDRNACVQLGKAFFWDMQAASDGAVSCGTCHFAGGADQRSKNTLHPGANKLFEKGAPNSTLKLSLFPFHKLSNPNDRLSPVVSDSDDIVGSQGVVTKNFGGIVLGEAEETGTSVTNPIFNDGGVNTRQVTNRNTPTMINGVYLNRIFWDGRGQNLFNGVNPNGALDPAAKILADDGAGLKPESILIDHAALASQAVGVPGNTTVFTWKGRKFSDMGRKLLNLKPLGAQAVHPADSVLGSVADPSGKGLTTTYASMISAAFLPRYWNSAATTADGHSLMEANFSLFWGLALQCYESTLISNDSPFDQFADGNAGALTATQKSGMSVFMGKGHCNECHTGAEFTAESVGNLAKTGLISRMQMGNGKLAVYDVGFYNIGVRPTAEDIGVGAKNTLGLPMSLTRLAQSGANVGTTLKPPISPTERVAVDGAFKVPSVRNVELTGPYFHTGGMATLEQVVDFYSRGVDFHEANIDNLDPHIENLALSATEKTNLVAFLKSLTDDRVRFAKAPFDHPQLVIPNGPSIPAVGKDGGAATQPFASTLAP
ncbi:MAG: cytochrome C peroxidase [Deltaproteobacteria bacterium]|nr:MAG: cytochrome C peroxidase [Deltaproteobacteria bacterium]